ISGGRDRVVRVWEVATGKQLRSFEHQKDWVEAIAVLPGGKQVLTGGGNALHLWELETGKLVRSFTGHFYGVTSIALARDGRTAFSPRYDGSVRAWDVESGQGLRRLGGHRNWVWCVSLSPDGRHLLSAGGGGQVAGKYVPGEDFAVRLWRLPARVVAR